MMLRQLSGTTATRILTTALGFATVIVATRYLGAHEYGNISLFVLSISLIQLLAGVAGGPALVYLAPRMPVSRLFSGSLIWSVGIHCVVGAVLLVTPWFDTKWLIHLLILSFVFYLNTFAYTTLLGKQSIREFNFIQILQAILLLGSLLAQVVISNEHSFILYIRSLYLAWGSATLYGWIKLSPHLEMRQWKIGRKQLGEMIRHGGFLQIANGLQLLNYRLSYFLIDVFLGRSLLGVFTAGAQLSEGLWIFGKSFAIVQYSTISNTTDQAFARKLSIQLMQLTFFITLAGLIVLLIIPQGMYEFVFGEGFGSVKTVIVFMSVGILSLSVSQILSHFFSGTGRQKFNAIGSGVGLIATLACGFSLIPTMGLTGAGLTASAAYSASAIYQLWVFMRITHTRAVDLAPQKQDIIRIADLLQKIARPDKSS